MTESRACSVPLALLLSVLLYLLDSFIAVAVGGGVALLALSVLVSLVGYGMAWATGDAVRRGCRIRQVLIFLVAGLAILITAVMESRLGDARMDRLIRAVESHREAHGTYPAHLAQLVPEQLDRLPRPGWHLMQEDFVYQIDGPYLIRHTALPAGRLVYRFQDQVFLIEN